MALRKVEPQLSLDIDRSQPEHVKIRFILDAGHPAGRVSLVGSFNNWTPGVDELVDDNHGTRGVMVGLPYGEEIVFRYLGPGDFWFDEPDADEITDQGSLIHAIERPRSP
ncbi:MAG: hypothetical protein QOE71_692 [Pseudonocardiales bacterium]|nr:hypothetical protein [Pseudonocardiales bacterium]